MKTLFEFILNKKVEQEETVVTETDGKKISTTSIIVKEIPVKVAIKKPTRDLVDEAKLFYAVQSSKAHQKGVISKVLLQKRLANDGGILSEREKAEFGQLYLNFFEKQKEYFLLDSRNFDELSQEEKDSKKKLQGEIGELGQKISAFESNNSSMFENTVEAYADNQTMRFYILSLSYVQKLDENNNPKDEFTPLFGTGDYDSKLKMYDKLEEDEDKFYLKSIKILASLISYWYIGSAQTTEDFQKLYDAYNSELAARDEKPE